jgi:hypothetical protein
VIEMAHIEKISIEAAKNELAKTPERKMGQWAKLVAEVKKDGQARKVTGLSRGSAWGLMRTAKQAGLTARVLEKGTVVVILPPVATRK